MSIWISRAILFPLLLSGCVVPDGAAGLLSGGGAAQTAQPRGITVSGLKLLGPPGFCALPATRQSVAGAQFVAFAPCDGTAGAVLTATIGAEGSADGLRLSQAALAPYFQTEQGKAALRGAGNKDGIAVQDLRDYKTGVIMRLTRETKGKTSDSWRALTQIEARLITLTVRPRQEGQTMGQGEGQRQIRRFVDAVRSANRL